MVTLIREIILWFADWAKRSDPDEDLSTLDRCVSEGCAHRG